MEGSRSPCPFLASLLLLCLFFCRAFASPSLELLLGSNSTGSHGAVGRQRNARALSQANQSSAEMDLLFAARDGDSRKVEEAIQMGATGSLSTPNELYTALIFAARGNHTDIVQQLLDLNVDINWQNRSGLTALWIASFMGHVEIVQALLKSEDVIVDLPNTNGITPLYAASQQAQRGIVGLLLSNGANPDMAAQNGATPLVAAAQVGDAIIVDLLAVNGADVNARKQPFQRPALWIASYHGHVHVVEVLIARGADVNLRSEDGTTSLFTASQHDWESIVLILLNNDADLTLTRDDGVTPLHIATVRGHDNVVEILIDFGADPLATNDQGQTAEDLLKMRDIGTSDKIQTLLTRGPTDSEGIVLSTQSNSSSVPPTDSLVSIPTQADKVVQPPRTQGDLEEADTLLHSSNPGTVPNSKSKLSAASIAIMLPLVALGFIFVISFAFIATHHRKKRGFCAQHISDHTRDNECPSQPAHILSEISHNPRDSEEWESSPSPQIIDVTFADAQIEISPQRNAMETNRSHIFTDGHYPEADIPEGNRPAEFLPMPSTGPAMTWNWMSEDGPPAAAENEDTGHQHAGMLQRHASQCRFDSSMLHNELRLDEEITQSPHEAWWLLSKKRDGQRYAESRAVEAGGPSIVGFTSPAKIVTATNITPVGSSADLELVSPRDLSETGEASCSTARHNFPTTVEHPLDECGEVLTRHVRRSRSEDQCYYMKDGVRTKVSGSIVRMTADEGRSSNSAIAYGDGDKRIIRILYKDR